MKKETISRQKAGADRFLPITKEECSRRGWDAPDFVYAVGEAYVDHPSFGHAIISRVLEKAGYKVAMLCLPDWHTCDDFKRFGRPKLGYLVTAGVIDSMVNHYTAAKRRRNSDVYAPGGKSGMRPDRAVTTGMIRCVGACWSTVPRHCSCMAWGKRAFLNVHSGCVTGCRPSNFPVSAAYAI